MRSHQLRFRHLAATIIAMATATTGACRSSEPRNDEERLARGREIIQRVSDKLAAAQVFTVTTQEVRDEVGPSNATRRVTLTRETTIRRPDRLYSKVSGDRQNELWYDGVGITLALHGDKVFGQAHAPETLDKTLDAIHERFGVDAPFADYAYSSPIQSLIADSTTGGWVARETLGSTQVDHLKFQDVGVEWEVWVPADGDPLPVKATVSFTDHPLVRHNEITFTSWNLAAQVTDAAFDPKVPADYEGVAILQSARILGDAVNETTAPAPTSQPAPKK